MQEWRQCQKDLLTVLSSNYYPHILYIILLVIAVIKGNTVNFQFRNDDDNNSSTTFQLTELNGLTKNKQGEFTLTREAGIMNFEGKFDGINGMGTYKFTANKNFSVAMAHEGVTALSESDLMAFFMVNVKISYIKMLKKNGYKDIDKDQ